MKKTKIALLFFSIILCPPSAVLGTGLENNASYRMPSLENADSLQLVWLLDRAKTSLNDSLIMSLKYAREAYTLAHTADRQAEGARALIIQSMACKLLGNREQALAHLLKALQTAQQLDDSPQKADLLLSAMGNFPEYTDSATVYTYLAQIDHLLAKFPDPLMSLRYYAHLGNFHYSQNQYPEALAQLTQARLLSERLGNVPMQADVLASLGNIHVELGQYDEALKKYRLAYATYADCNNTYALTWVANNIAATALKNGDFSAAAHFIQLAKDTAFTYSYAQWIEHILKTEADLLHAQQAYPEASLAYAKLAEFKDSLLRASESSTMDKLRLQLELQRQESGQKIQLLKKDVDFSKSTFRSILLIAIGVILFLSVLLVGLFFVRHEKLKIYSTRLKQQHQQISQQQAQMLQMNKQLECIIEERTHELLKRTLERDQYSFFHVHKLRGSLSRLLGLINVFQLTEEAHEKAELIALLERTGLELDDIMKEFYDGQSSEPAEKTANGKP